MMLSQSVDGVGFDHSDHADICNARANFIFMFEDVVSERQNVLRSYFSMGWHSNVECFYLAQ